MTRSKLPATLVLCATAPRQTLAVRASSWLDAARAVAVPVTWVVGIDSLAGIASGVGDVDLALDIPPAACGSRSRLRDLLARARDITPGMTSVVLRGPTPPAHRGLLVEEGISVALVDTFDAGESSPGAEGLALPQLGLGAVGGAGRGAPSWRLAGMARIRRPARGEAGRTAGASHRRRERRKQRLGLHLPAAGTMDLLGEPTPLLRCRGCDVSLCCAGDDHRVGPGIRRRVGAPRRLTTVVRPAGLRPWLGR